MISKGDTCFESSYDELYGRIISVKPENLNSIKNVYYPEQHEKRYTEAASVAGKSMAAAIDKEILSKLGERKTKVRVGDYVVYVKNGDYSKLGLNAKDIWKVINIGGYDIVESLVTVQSITSGRGFDTTNTHLRTMGSLKMRADYTKDWFSDRAYTAYLSREKKKVNNNIVENENMNSNNMVTRTMDSNVEAAKVAAKITAGNTLNKVFIKQLVNRKILPIMVRGYADTAFGAVVIANIADFAVKQFNVKNPKARLATEAMMQAAMLDLLAEVDFEGIINDVLDNVDLGDIVD